MKAKIGHMTVNPWKIYQEEYTTKDGEKKTRVAIRRWVIAEGKGKAERYPIRKYKAIENNPTELEGLVRRLNAEIFREQEAIQKILDRTAFLNNDMIEKYRQHLSNHMPDEKKITHHINMLQQYVINVFVGEFNLINPKDWEAAEDKWYGFLLSEKAPAAASTKKRILQAFNRFLTWLHKERPNEIPRIIFEGPGIKKMQSIERERAVAGELKKRGYIKDEDWNKIQEKLPDDIKPWILLCYRYGLRRSESLGLAYEGVDCVFEDCLELKRQMVYHNKTTGKSTFDKLKTQGRESISKKPTEKRTIPHWWFDLNPNETADLIEEGMKHLMAPEVLSEKWRELMDSIGMTYDIHDLRHTWITKAVAGAGKIREDKRQYSMRDVQLAAGHASIETTEGYSHDIREFERKPIRKRAA